MITETVIAVYIYIYIYIVNQQPHMQTAAKIAEYVMYTNYIYIY